MTATDILATLRHAGITLRLTADRQSLVAPAGRLDAAQRAMVIQNKPELIRLLSDAHITTERLLVAAMKVCDRHNDNDAARQEMRDQCLALPPHLQTDLLQHFRGAQP